MKRLRLLLAAAAIAAVPSGNAMALGITWHVDCAAPAGGDGSPGNPFNDLSDAWLEATAGDTLQIDGGVCLLDFPIWEAITVQGNPSLPHAEVSTADWMVDVITSDPVTLRHLRLLPNSLGTGAVRADAENSHVVLEDMLDAAVMAGGFNGYPSYEVRGGAHIVVHGQASGSGIIVDVEGTAGLSFEGWYSSGIVRAMVRDSEITGLDIQDHGVWDVVIENSVIEADHFMFMLGRYGGALDLVIRDSVIRDSTLIVEHVPCQLFGPGCAADPLAVSIEGNRFVDSIVEYRYQNRASMEGSHHDEVLIQNNVFERSGVRGRLFQDHPDFTQTFGRTRMRVRHNTFIDPPTAIDVLAATWLEPGVHPTDWFVEAANNVIAGGGTGVAVSNDADPLYTLISSRIAGNDFFGTGNDISTNAPALIEGNIQGDPLFADPASGDYTPGPGSPCIDAALAIDDAPADDFAGTARPQDGDGDGDAVADIGALEALLPIDGDGDGFTDAQDCDDADPAIHPGATELPGNTVDENCDQTLLCSPSAGWRRHGQFVVCVSRAATELFRAGLITEQERDALIGDAAQSSVGRNSDARRSPRAPSAP